MTSRPPHVLRVAASAALAPVRVIVVDLRRVSQYTPAAVAPTRSHQGIRCM